MSDDDNEADGEVDHLPKTPDVAPVAESSSDAGETGTTEQTVDATVSEPGSDAAETGAGDGTTAEASTETAGTGGTTAGTGDAESQQEAGGASGRRRTTPPEQAATEEDHDTEFDADLPPQELGRAFSVLEEALTSDAVGGRQLDQLLSVFEQAIANPGETDPETVAELISMLEELIIEPDDLSQVDLAGFLSVFEEAIAGTTGAEPDEIADVFEIIEEGIRDPTSVDPDDIERFRSGIESAIVEFTDPASGGFGGLFSLPGLMGEQTETIDEDDSVDTFRLARIAAGMTQRATGYSMESGVRTGTRMAYAAANSQSPAELLTNTRAIALDELQRAGVDIGEQQSDWLDSHEEEVVDARPLTLESLEERGEKLLSQSAEIGRDESIHPSFPVVLDQLATDEARILRLLAIEGPQGAVDVYDKQYVPFKSRLVAEDLTMLGSDAGCRIPERVPVYVQNLRRLGMVKVSEEPVENLKRYQVLEAQSHVELARDSAKRAKTVYKSVRLTDFGAEFCEMCFPFNVEAGKRTMYFRRESGE